MLPYLKMMEVQIYSSAIEVVKLFLVSQMEKLARKLPIYGIAISVKMPVKFLYQHFSMSKLLVVKHQNQFS